MNALDIESAAELLAMFAETLKAEQTERGIWANDRYGRRAKADHDKCLRLAALLMEDVK